ncbi:MAG: metal-dependent transcriptional regulator [Pseudomonadota bacterium]|nr:metal-dependent transcriptional regulator [Pseudomonadota bacterium]
MKSKLTSTQAAYLVAVYELEKVHRIARVGSIAKVLKVGLSSVSAALKTLADKKLLNYEPHSYITLTGDGLNLSQELTKRKTVLFDFLHDTLAIPSPDADLNARNLEQAIDNPTYDRLLDFINFINTCPRAGEKWRKGFKEHCHDPLDPEHCEPCLEQNLESFYQNRETTKETAQLSSPTTLADLQPGEKARITGLKDANRRMAEMGLLPGAIITMEKIAPLGDPFEIRLKGFNLSLRKQEAAAIEVEQVEG